MKEHKHCKICKKVLTMPNYDTPYYHVQMELYWEIEICLNCVIEKGLQKFKRKSKNKPEGMEFGKND